MSYSEDVLEFTNIEAGENICVAGMELNVLKTLDGYDGYLGIGNGGFTNGVQVIVDDAIYERLTGKDTYSEFLPTLNEGADRENFDTFIEAFCNRIPGTTFLSYEETDQQLKESFAQIQMLAWGLILFVGLIGILNIINTVYTNIHTRVTEIGMQRAIGMSAGSLYKTFLWEGAYYGIIASVIGSVLVDKDQSVKQAGGFIIQLMPFTPEEVVDRLEKKITEIDSVTQMLDRGLTPEQILEEILGDFGLEITDTTETRFHCDCSKERVSRALSTLSKKDLDSIIADGESIEVKCQFCNKAYEFTVDELKEMR